MNFRHAAALALVGWYLMAPPTQEALDSSCSNPHGIFYYLTTLVSRESDGDRISRCDHEGIMLVPDANYSQWFQEGEFETLADCRTEQQKPPTEQEKALTNLASGLAASSGISKDDLARSQRQSLALSKYIASDDPRLKEK
jgi:hypothetical protein